MVIIHGWRLGQLPCPWLIKLIQQVTCIISTTYAITQWAHNSVQRWINIESTLTTIYQCWFNVLCPLGGTKGRILNRKIWWWQCVEFVPSKGIGLDLGEVSLQCGTLTLCAMENSILNPCWAPFVPHPLPELNTGEGFTIYINRLQFLF